VGKTLEELRAMVGALDPDVLAAEAEVDRTLIVLSLERSPLERVRFAQQMLQTLLSFEGASSTSKDKVALPLLLATLDERRRRDDH
jgi:hypothetical protein